VLADLDVRRTAVFATADDLLAERARNARRSVTDAEVVTLAVARAVIDIGSDREFLAVAATRLGHGFGTLPGPPGDWERRARRSWPPPTRRNAMSRCGGSRSGGTAASRWSATRAMPAATSNRPPPNASAQGIPRPPRTHEPGRGPVPCWIRQRIESNFLTRKDRLGLQRHRARSLHGPRAPIATKRLTLAASGTTTTTTAPPAPSRRSPPNDAWNQSSSRWARRSAGRPPRPPFAAAARRPARRRSPEGP